MTVMIPGASLPAPYSRAGPYAVNGDLYVALQHVANDQAGIFRSVDDGATWSHVVPSGADGTALSGTFMDSLLEGDSICVLFLNGGNQIRIGKFNTTNDSWTFEVTGATVSTEHQAGPVALFAKPDPFFNYLVAFNSEPESIMGGSYERVSIARLEEGNGSWFAPQVMGGGGQESLTLATIYRSLRNNEISVLGIDIDVTNSMRRVRYNYATYAVVNTTNYLAGTGNFGQVLNQGTFRTASNDYLIFTRFPDHTFNVSAVDYNPLVVGNYALAVPIELYIADEREFGVFVGQDGNIYSGVKGEGFAYEEVRDWAYTAQRLDNFFDHSIRARIRDTSDNILATASRTTTTSGISWVYALQIQELDGVTEHWADGHQGITSGNWSNAANAFNGSTSGIASTSSPGTEMRGVGTDIEPFAGKKNFRLRFYNSYTTSGGSNLNGWSESTPISVPFMPPELIETASGVTALCATVLSEIRLGILYQDATGAKFSEVGVQAPALLQADPAEASAGPSVVDIIGSMSPPGGFLIARTADGRVDLEWDPVTEQTTAIQIERQIWTGTEDPPT